MIFLMNRGIFGQHAVDSGSFFLENFLVFLQNIFFINKFQSGVMSASMFTLKNCSLFV